MRILLIRHGVAEVANGSSRSAEKDAQRPLSKVGRKKMRKAARGILRLAPKPDLIAASPLTRAAQTAEIVAEEYPGIRTLQIAALSPRKPTADLLEWLAAHPPKTTVALVGHEPSLSTFLCLLLTGLEESFLELRKGGAALVEMPDPPAAGRGKLLWLLKPSQLRRIGRD